MCGCGRALNSVVGLLPVRMAGEILLFSPLCSRKSRHASDIRMIAIDATASRMLKVNTRRTGFPRKPCLASTGVTTISALSSGDDGTRRRTDCSNVRKRLFIGCASAVVRVLRRTISLT